MSVSPGFENDIFISYSHSDDQSLLDTQRGWVSTLLERLAIRLPQLLGAAPQIYSERSLQGNDYFEGNLIFNLSNSAILIAIVTPRYVRSEWALRELREFIRRAEESGGTTINGKPRIFKVMKTWVPYEEQPAELRDLPSYNFFEIDRATKRTKEFKQDIGAEYDARYWERFDDLARNIKSILESIRTLHDVHEPPFRQDNSTHSYEVLDASGSQRSLRVFLCHSTEDKAAIRTLYEKLRAQNIEPWLDEKSLIAGQLWQKEIPKAVRNSDVVIVCLSQKSTSKKGYVQKEIKYALDVADEQPEGTIFLIPLRLEECEVPDRLTHLHWVNYFEETGYEQLMHSLRARAGSLSVNAGPT